MEEGQGEVSDGGPLLEGAHGDQNSAASREGVPPFRGQSQPTGNLTLLHELDEPEQLILELKRLADERSHNKRWVVVSRACQRAIDAFEVLHRAPETPIAREP